jgi:predicted DNA-binding transcriptional regulator YafY
MWTDLVRLIRETADMYEKWSAAMDRPATRLLTLLELMQNRHLARSAELAAELGVDQRTIRRYMQALQEMGIPVETVRGRDGGYRLLPGFRLPPLMFNEEEAIGLTIALLMSRASLSAGAEHAIDQALAKIERVLPTPLLQRVLAVRDGVVSADLEQPFDAPVPNPTVLATLCQASLSRNRCWLRYSARDGDETAREVDPYGVVTVGGRWYLHGWCYLREDRRTFRVDRVRRVDVLPQTFEPPADLDVLEAVMASLALARANWQVVFEVDAPLGAVREELPPRFAVAEPLPDGRTRLRCSAECLEWIAWRLLPLPWPVTIIEPDELRDAFAALADRANALADRKPAGSHAMVAAAS